MTFFKALNGAGTRQGTGKMGRGGDVSELNWGSFSEWGSRRGPESSGLIETYIFMRSTSSHLRGSYLNYQHELIKPKPRRPAPK